MLLAPVASSDPPEDNDSEFVFARIQFNMHMRFGRWGGWREPPWMHDHPYAEDAFLTVLKEVTAIRVQKDSFKIVRLDSPELFKYPFAYICEVGFLNLTDAETLNFREYLNRGGFVMVDDFRGPRDFENFLVQMKKVFPDRDLIPLDISHPIFNSFYDFESLDVVPPYGDEAVRFFGLEDKRGNLQMVVNHNDDLGEYWEWLDQGAMPLKPAAESLKLGINYLVYAMTH